MFRGGEAKKSKPTKAEKMYNHFAKAKKRDAARKKTTAVAAA